MKKTETTEVEVAKQDTKDDKVEEEEVKKTEPEEKTEVIKDDMKDDKVVEEKVE